MSANASPTLVSAVVLGAAAALLGIEPAVRVHVGLEAGQERGTAGRGGMP